MRISFHKIARIPAVLLAALLILVLSAGMPASESKSATSAIGYSCAQATIDSDTLVKDTQAYADAFGVSQKEAARRLLLQDDIGCLNAVLSSNENSTFAGLWVENTPTYRVIIQFTSDGESTFQKYNIPPELASVIEVRSTDTSLVDLQVLQDAASKALQAAKVEHVAGVNVQANYVEINVLLPEQAKSALAQASILPNAKIVIIQWNQMPQLAADVWGGQPVANCTLGFAFQVVGQSTKGILSAYHCGTPLNYNGTNFSRIAGSQSHDIAGYNTPGYTPIAFVNDGGGGRDIHGKTYDANQSIGTVVCKYGKTTGFTCGDITRKGLTVFIGYNVYNVTEVHRVAGPMANSGDSGAPVYLGNYAYGGLFAGQTGNLAYYVPIDYIESDLHVSILTR